MLGEIIAPVHPLRPFVCNVKLKISLPTATPINPFCSFVDR